jgi:hypothetical protein
MNTVEGRGQFECGRKVNYLGFLSKVAGGWFKIFTAVEMNKSRYCPVGIVTTSWTGQQGFCYSSPYKGKRSVFLVCSIQTGSGVEAYRVVRC